MSDTLTAPALTFLAVTPSDSVSFPSAARALYIGAAGNVTCLNASGAAVTFVGITAGSILPVFTFRVNATNTTATSIVALF